MLRTTFLFALGALACLTAPAHAQKVNLAYVEDAPQPIGNLTSEQIAALAKSDFTHLIFAFINLCTPDASKESGFTCPGDSPVPVWNIKPVYDANGQPIAEVQAAMKTLSDAGKTIYMSIGAAVNPETWDYMANATPAEATAAGAALQTFMTDYHVTGVDFDYEAGSSDGFGVLASVLGKLTPQPPFSMAPYRTANPPQSYDTVSTQWQYCQFLNAGVTPTLINRQYYAGGISFDVPNSVAGDLKPFNCANAGGSGTEISIPPAQMTPGIGIQGIQGTANCAPAGQSPIYGDCAAIGASVVAAQPDIGGMSLWRADLLSDPVAYACEMGNALNGTEIACN